MANQQKTGGATQPADEGRDDSTLLLCDDGPADERSTMNWERSTDFARERYWDRYYSFAKAPMAPSQFAVFMWGELAKSTAIIDVGCGTGRDSYFFAQQGLFTIGLDQSQAAIDLCERRRTELGLPNVQFHCGSVADPGLADEIERKLVEAGADGAIAIYARFFLHAIADDEEAAFLQFASDLIDSRTGHLGLEFRTIRDRHQTKVTPDHFRRFVDPVRFINLSQSRGFELTYFVEGFGFAKHMQDDAHVARCIFTRRA